MAMADGRFARPTWPNDTSRKRPAPWSPRFRQNPKGVVDAGTKSFLHGGDSLRDSSGGGGGKDDNNDVMEEELER